MNREEWYRRLYGPAPERGATRLERLLYVRRVLTRSLPFYAPLLVAVVVFGTTGWALYAMGACVVLNVINFAWLEVRIRRESRAGR
jgi:hypothetical protein